MSTLFRLPRAVPVNGAGLPYAGAKANFYLTGTTTPTDTYSDAALTTPNANPVVADSAGLFTAIYLDPDVDYKLTLTESDDTLIYTVDPVHDELTQANIGLNFQPQTNAESNAGVTPVNYFYPELTVDRYLTNTTPGTTDMTTAVQDAVDVASQLGGGTIRFLPGFTYVMTIQGTHSVVIPIAGTNRADDTQNMSYAVLLDNLDNIKFEFNGATVFGNDTPGAMFLVDGGRNISFENAEVISIHEHNTTTGADITVGMFFVAATSQDRDSFNISERNIHAQSILNALYCFGTSTSTFRIRGVNMENVLVNHGRRVIALHENGDHFNGVGLHGSGCLRDFFIFGANHGRLDMTADTGVNGFRALLKAYLNPTRDWHIRYISSKTLTATAQVGLESDYITAVQSEPEQVLGITLDIDNIDGSTTADSAVAFTVYEDSGIVRGSNQTFHGIVVKGIHTDDMDVSMGQDVPGSLDTSGIVYLAGDPAAVYQNTGFYDPQQVAGKGLETVTGTVNASLYTLETAMDSSGGAVAVTLGSGLYDNQTKTFSMSDASNASTLTVTAHDTSSPEVFTFDSTADYLVLKWSRIRQAWWTVQNAFVAT